MQELYKHNRHMEQLHIQIIKVWRFLPFALHPARPVSLESVFVIFPVFFGGVDRWPEEIEYCFTKRLHGKKKKPSSFLRHNRLARRARRASTRRSGSS